MRQRPGSRGFITIASAAAALIVTGGAAAAPGECPQIMPTSELVAGDLGEGWTVSQGTAPDSFDGEVLGVLTNAIGPGRDMIIVEATSPAIDTAGGIWAGMSGSPFYVDDEFVGVVAYGLTLGPSPIAGLTPAPEIRRIHQYPVVSASSSPVRVKLPGPLARKVASRAGVALRAASTLARLKTPVSVSGVPDRGFKRLNAIAKRTGSLILAYRGAAASAFPAADPTEIVPGGNFAATLSYGDVTVGGVGTTSYVCDGKAVAFGHPFFALGRTAAAASVADALTVVHDGVTTPFKLATIGGSVGILDQDRIGGIRTLLGTTPETTPIETSFVSRDTIRSREGHTGAVVSDFLADIGFMHVLANMDSVQDAIGRGSARLDWTVTGTHADGDPWMLQRRDSFASAFDLSFEASVQIADELFAIGSFRDEGVTVESIRVGGWLEQAYKAYRIKRVLLRRGGVFRPVGEEIEAPPGHVLRFQIVLKSLTGGSDVVSRLRLQLPDRFRFAVVEIAGGPLEQGCEDEFCEGAETFGELLEQLGSKREHSVLSAVLLSGRNLAERAVDTERLNRFVEGRRTIFVAAPGFGSGEGGG